MSSWWHRLLRRRHMEQDLEKELRFHLTEHANDLLARGESPPEARRKAQLSLGGYEQVKEGCRDARGTRWLEDLLYDLRYAVRSLRQRPGFTAVALLTLALGVGVTSVMFNVVNGILLMPLSYPESDRLVSLHEEAGKAIGEWNFAYLNFLDCQRESRTLQMAAWRYRAGVISEPGDAEYVPGREISADLFPVLEIPVSRGRAFLPNDDRPGATPVAIISDHLWRARFGANPGAIGSSVVFEDKPYTIVGIAPPGFRLSGDVDVFLPIGQNTETPLRNREMHPGLNVVARLRPGVTLAQANAELALIAAQLAKEYPKSNQGRSFAARALRDEVVGDVRPMLWLLLGAVSLVLLIACVNVASLLLARGISRERELAMRMALGAGRGRLIRQCLTESAVLALGGGVLGVMVAAFGTRPFLLLWPGGLPRTEEVHLDWRVLLFVLAASLICGLLFGLAPALRAPMTHVEQTLRAGSRTVAGGSRRLHSGFVRTEITLAVVLLFAAGTMGHTLLRISSLSPGIDVHKLLTVHVALSQEQLANPAVTRAAWRDVIARVHSVPGVEYVATCDIVPMTGDTEQVTYWTTPNQPAPDQMRMALMNIASPEYLRVMQIPLLRGRFFSDGDRLGSEPVVVIDEVFARRVFGTVDAVDRRVSFQFLGSARVIGVVGHVRHWGLDSDDQAKVRDQFYIPFSQLPDQFMPLTSGMPVAIRTSVAPLSTVESIRRAVRSATRGQAIYDVQTMENILSSSLGRQRFLVLLFGIFAVLALALACVGIYGVLAYLTTQRVPEIGVRMALGASAGLVMRLVLRQSLRMIFVGLTLGIAASLATGSLLGRLMNGVKQADPLTFSIMSLVLLSSALLASFLPARRASRIDPIAALRQE